MTGTGTASAAVRVRFELVDSRRRDRQLQHRPMTLTVRELQVIEGIVRAESNRRIAARLSLSPHTVKHHLTSIFAKLGVSTRVQLAVFVIKRRFMEMDVDGPRM